MLNALSTRLVRTRTVTFSSIALGEMQREPADSVEPTGYLFTAVHPARLSTDPVIALRGRAAIFTARAAEGHRCFAFTDMAGLIAAYFWLTVAGDVPLPTPWEFGQRFSLPARTAYVWDCYTIPAHRRRGLYRAGLHRCRSVARTDGAQYLLVSAVSGNDASARGIADVGCMPLGTWMITRAGVFIMVRASTERPIIRLHPATFNLFGFVTFTRAHASV